MLRFLQYGVLTLIAIFLWRFFTVGERPTWDREHPRWQVIERHLREAGAEAARWAEESLEPEY